MQCKKTHELIEVCVIQQQFVKERNGLVEIRSFQRMWQRRVTQIPW